MKQKQSGVQDSVLSYARPETKEECAARCAASAPVRWQDSRREAQGHLGSCADYQDGHTPRQKESWSMPDYWTTK